MSRGKVGMEYNNLEDYGGRLRKIESDTAVIKQQIKDHCKTQEQDFNELKSGLDNLNDKFDNLPDKLDERYAPKWVERVTWFLVGGAIGLIFYAIEKFI